LLENGSLTRAYITFSRETDRPLHYHYLARETKRAIGG